MSSLNKRIISHAESSLTLVMSAAEGRLLMALGRQSAAGMDLLFAQDWQATAQGVELLAPALHSALGALKLTPRHIGRIAAVNGPGSFTGLRLSIITASGLARAIGAKQAALPYLPLLAANAVAQLQDAGLPEEIHKIWAVTHARRELVHAQGFVLKDGALGPASNILVLSLDEAASCLKERKAVILGSGLSKNRDFFANALPGARLMGASFDQPAPAFLLRTALSAEYGDHDIAPLYARQSDAEENLPHISARLGFDPDESRKRLKDILSSAPQNLE